MYRRNFFRLLGVSPVALMFKPEKKISKIAWDDYFGLSDSPVKHPIKNKFILLTSDDGTGTAGILMKFDYYNSNGYTVYKTLWRVK